MHSGSWVGSVNFNMAEGMSINGLLKSCSRHHSWVGRCGHLHIRLPVWLEIKPQKSGETRSLKEWPVFLASYYKHPMLKPRKCLQQFPPIALVDGHPGKDHQSSCWHLFPRVWRHLKPNKLYVRMKTLKYQVVWLTRDVYDGHEECVVTRYHPRCWRCGQRCDFYKQQKKNYPSFENFRVEKVWITHFLTMTLIKSTQVASPNFIYCVNELLCMWNIMQISHKFVWPVRYP